MAIYTKKYPPGYYVYIYIRSQDSLTVEHGKKGTPYYVGKGYCYRAWEKHGNVRTPKDKTNIILIATNLSEEAAHAIERVQIIIWGRIDLGTGILHNKTFGGEGVSGMRHTPEARTKMSEQRKGRQPWNKGINLPAYMVENMKISRKGRKLTEEHKEKLRQKFLAVPRSAEVREKISQSTKGLKNSLGSKRNEDFKNKMSHIVRGSHYWNNGTEMKRAIHCPGPGWIAGRLNTGARYWNNGKTMKKSAQCPGDGWNLGKLSTGAQYWHNGQEIKRSVECPGPGWCRGRLNKGTKYWTDGQKTKQSVDCPGIGWTLGRAPRRK